MPEFPGGQEKLMEFLAKSMKYPVEAQKNNEQGRVIVQMAVEADGSISNIKVIRSVSPSLDAEAMRAAGSIDRKSVVKGKSVDLGGRRIIKKKNNDNKWGPSCSKLYETRCS